ncbi:hypothetical protein ACQ4PT_031790 [Festuca glaucescens]
MPQSRGILRHARTPRGFVHLLAAGLPPHPSSAEQFHAVATKLGFAASVFAGTALLNLYCRSRRLGEAQQLFDEMPEKSGVTWSTFIYGHVQSHEPILAVRAFGRMVHAGVSPTASAMSSVLVACAKMQDSGVGAMVHTAALKCSASSSNVVVGTALVDMYAKCHDVPAAQRVFEDMKEKNVATFTALVSGFALDGRPRDAMLLVRKMEQSGVAPNMMTYSSLLSSFASPRDLDHGRQAHCVVLKKGLEQNQYILSTLMTMYSRCGSLDGFRKVQAAVSCQHDQISLNSVISGLSCLGRGGEAFQHFLEMRRHGADTDVFTFTSMLKAIGNSSSLLQGRQVHALILKTGHGSDANVQNGLISMYARRGEIGESRDVFASVQAPDLVSWNSLLSGYAQHGYGQEVVEVFEQMRRLNVQPDHTTFLLVLTACSHAGLVDKGLEPSPRSRVSGHRHAYGAGVSVYRALLSACQIHGNLEIAVRMSACLIELYPHDSSAHVQLSKAFAGDGQWGSSAVVREAMTGKGIVKSPA